MRISIEVAVALPADGCRIGNVYHQKGGYGVKEGYMMVVVAIKDQRAIYLIVDKHGDIVGANHYGTGTFDGRIPIAFVEGLDELELTMRSI